MWSSNDSSVSTSSEQNMYDFNDIPRHIVGDKVEVQLLGTNKILSLAEVQVFGYLNEIRPDRDARVEKDLSSTLDEYPYWHVLLGSPVVIDTVVIHNRYTNQSDSRLRGFVVEIWNLVDGNESVVYSYEDPTPYEDPGPVIHLPIDIIGNKVRISFPSGLVNLKPDDVQVFSSVGCFDLNGDANNRLCQAPNLKVSYYEDNLNEVPYQTNIDFGNNVIRLERTYGQVFTSGRKDEVAARFVGYAIFDTGSYSICLDSDIDSDAELCIDRDLSLTSEFEFSRP
eukprot:963502_1